MYAFIFFNIYNEKKKKKEDVFDGDCTLFLLEF